MKRNEKGSAGAWGVVAAVVLVVVLPLAIWGLSVLLSPTIGKGEAYKDVQGDGKYRNAQTTAFYNDCAAIQTKESQIDAAIKNYEAEKDPAMKQVLLKNKTALEAQRVEQINQYNADVNNKTVKGFLKADGLPTHIDPNQKETKCE